MQVEVIRTDQATFDYGAGIKKYEAEQLTLKLREVWAVSNLG